VQGSRQPELSETELRFRTVVEAALDAIVLADMAGNIISWNPGAETLFGYVEAEVIGKPLTILMPARFHAAHLNGLERLRQTGERRRVGRTSQLEAVRKDGQEFPIEISLGTWVASEGRYFCGIIRDVTERKALEEALRYSALHDPLVHLPNRAFFAEEIQRAAGQAQRRDALTGLLIVDLDNFKQVNDRFGHPAGDVLLKTVGERLRSQVRVGDTVARFGGDEFVVLLEELPGPQDVEVTARRIVQQMRLPFSLGEQSTVISASVGVALRQGGFNPDHFLRDADRALYAAKARGKGRYEIAAN
jgi:diguanylate cyclase (GGDEF)-like protein/PAS domain S-box-containing protein